MIVLKDNFYENEVTIEKYCSFFKKLQNNKKKDII